MRASALVLTIAVFVSPARGDWVDLAEEVPAERLLANVKTRIEADPADASAHYVLARLHSLLWSRGGPNLRVIIPDSAGGLPDFSSWESVRVAVGTSPEGDDIRRVHLVESVAAYRRAVGLAPDRPLYRLGLAWMLEQGGAEAAAVGAPPGDAAAGARLELADKFALVTWIETMADADAERAAAAEQQLRDRLVQALPMLVEAKEHQNPEVRKRIGLLLARRWEDQALEQYQEAFSRAVGGDLEGKGGGPAADARISLEAGEAILRMVHGRRQAGETGPDTVAVEKAVSDLKRRPRAITPLVFPLGGATASVAELLHPGRTVDFDLAGDGVPARWPWVGGDTGMLAWDPRGTGRIESGRQLFGGATWWLFWEDGFQALAGLDDDHDGQLAKGELSGIAVWRDVDGDGTSDPGEVVPAGRAGIVAIETRPLGRIDGVLWHPCGIRLDAGATRPLYDWVPLERN